MFARAGLFDQRQSEPLYWEILLELLYLNIKMLFTPFQHQHSSLQSHMIIQENISSFYK